MDMSRACRTWWGFDPKKTPFGNTIEEAGGLFLWPAFDDTVELICEAVLRRRFLCVVGVPCSAKSTAWAEASRRLKERRSVIHLARPRGIDPQAYSEPTIYLALQACISPTTHMRRMREERAAQCRALLEKCNDAKQPVCLLVNDAHACREQFLVTVKRLWDDLYGYDRMLSVILVGHPQLAATVATISEIDQRSELVILPGLGDALPAYLAHECARCGLAASPFDDSAIEELYKLGSDNWTASKDHPLYVNNVVSLAMTRAHEIKHRPITADLIAEAARKAR